MDWLATYRGVVDRVPALCASACLCFCGLSICVDATIVLTDALRALRAAGLSEADALADLLATRARQGIGGELRVDWAGGPSWLDAHLAPRLSLGGTGPHAARLMTLLGAPNLLAVATRSREQLAVLDAAIEVASGGRAVRVDQVAPIGEDRPKIYIFEFTAGQVLDGHALARSSRIIVRFTDPGIEDDRDFAALSAHLAPEAGAAILSGFNAIGAGDLDAALDRTLALVASWRRGGDPLIHLELAGYDAPRYRDRVLERLAGAIGSLGLSLSELEAIAPGSRTDLAGTVVALADRLGVRRLCVHADDWAATATTDDPAREHDSLLLGCLLASARAGSGRPVYPDGVPDGARFADPPPLPSRHGSRHLVAVAAPFLDHPATTLGLGDTFTAGCLVVQSAARRAAQEA